MRSSFDPSVDLDRPSFDLDRPSFELGRQSFSTARNWEIFDTPSPPRRSCVCSSSSASLSGARSAPRLSITTPLSERQGGKFFSFSACSTPASNYVFRCLGSGEVGAPRRILIVVDASKDVTTESLEWTLTHIAQPGDFVTILGLLPWLTLPMAVKRWAKLKKIDESPGRFESPEFVRIQELYATKGVFLGIQILSGFPRRDIAVDMARRIDARWIIFYKWMCGSSNYIIKRLGKKRNIVYLTSKSEGIVLFASKPAIISIHEAPGFSNSPSNQNPVKVELNFGARRMKLSQWMNAIKL